jgi:YVTN family beta-propeller protein
MRRLITAGVALPGILFLFVSLAPAQGLLLVSHNAERQVAAIDPATQRVLMTFPSPKGPHEITVSRDAATAYIADSGTGPGSAPGNSIVVIDLKRRIPKATLQVCEMAHDTRVSRDGRRLWVACAPMKAVQEIDTTTGAVNRSWNTGLEGGWFVEITPDERKIYVPHLEGKALTVIDRKTGTSRAVFAGTTQFGITISPDGREVWVSDGDENKLSIVDTRSDKVSATIKLGPVEKGRSSFSRLRFTPNGRQVVIVQNSKFMAVDARGRSVNWSLDLPHPGKVVTVSADSRRAFVSHPGHNRVSVIDLSNRRIEQSFVTGKQPDGVAWIEASRSK